MMNFTQSNVLKIPQSLKFQSLKSKDMPGGSYSDPRILFLTLYYKLPILNA